MTTENVKRLTTQYLIFINGNLEFFIQVIPLTSELYAKINEVLSIQQLGVLPIIVAVNTIAIVVLIILLKKWNILLAGEVKRRTQQLDDSYEETRI